MNKLLSGTQFVLADEPCYRLAEVNLQSPNSRGFHRYQLIWVVRDDQLTEYVEDMGLSKNIAADPVIIMGCADETVARMKHMADQIRWQPPFDKRELAACDKVKIEGVIHGN